MPWPTPPFYRLHAGRYLHQPLMLILSYTPSARRTSAVVKTRRAIIGAAGFCPESMPSRRHLFRQRCSTNSVLFAEPLDHLQRLSLSFFQPWLASTHSGLSVTERMISTKFLSPSSPIFTFNDVIGRRPPPLSLRTTSAVSIPIVNDGREPPGRESPISYTIGLLTERFPVRSCSAISHRRFRPWLSGAAESTYLRISSIRNGSANWLRLLI